MTEINADDNDRQFIAVKGHFVAETEKGVLLHIIGGAETWLPKSQIGRVSYVIGEGCEICLAEDLEAIELPWWLAKENGIV